MLIMGRSHKRITSLRLYKATDSLLVTFCSTYSLQELLEAKSGQKKESVYWISIGQLTPGSCCGRNGCLKSHRRWQTISHPISSRDVLQSAKCWAAIRALPFQSAIPPSGSDGFLSGMKMLLQEIICFLFLQSTPLWDLHMASKGNR